MKIKTAELTGTALGWAVATCEGYTNLRRNPHQFDNALIMDPPRKEYGPTLLSELDYHHDWAQGGPIVERELDGWSRRPDGSFMAFKAKFPLGVQGYGLTLLFAAMRCHVASEMGDEVDVPDELADQAPERVSERMR